MKRLFMYLSVGIIILASASCKTDSGRKEYSSVLVKTLTVGNKDSVEYVKYSGVINSEKEVTIAFKVNGQIAFLPENEGMSFRKGSIIATLDKHDFEVQYNAAKAVFEQSEKETKRIQALFENNTVSPNDYEKVIAANKVAEAKFNAAEDALRYTEIKAPFDCFISDIFKNSGEIVSAGMPVLLLKQEGGYKADISMALKDYSRLKNLIYAELVCGNLSTAITLKAQNRNASNGQLYNVSFDIPSEFSKVLSVGMNVDIRLAYSSTTPSLSLPASALFQDKGNTCVWKINNGKAACTPVKLIRIERETAFVRGLEPHDRIAITGIHSLSEGQTVEEMKEVSSTNIGGML